MPSSDSQAANAEALAVPEAHEGASSRLRTRAGVLTLLLLCGVQFLDVVDSSITNVAFPSIQRALHISHQNLQWVAIG